MHQVEHTAQCSKWEFDVLDEKEVAKAIIAEDEIFSKGQGNGWRCLHCPANDGMTYTALTGHLKLQ